MQIIPSYIRKQNYPYTNSVTTYLNTAPYVKTTTIDTTRVGRMIGQADQIAT
jgi:hypothetical protein